MSIEERDRPPDYLVLDPCLLGRPVHLLPGFAARLAESFGAAMAAPGSRRHWGAYRLERLAFERMPGDLALRWLGVQGPFGLASVAFERSLLLGLLEGRYLRRAPLPDAHPIPALEPVTATEERLASTLAVQLALLLDEGIAAGLAAAGAGAQPVPAAPPSACAPGGAGWVIHVVLRAQYGRRGSDAPGLAPPAGQVWIGLDQRLMDHVLQGLTGQRGSPRIPSGAPLASRLALTLAGRLVSREITLATLFGLRVGDVIPVAVGRADVLLDDSRLFTADVAEHQGQLCLTSFEDAESWT